MSYELRCKAILVDLSNANDERTVHAKVEIVDADSLTAKHPMFEKALELIRLQLAESFARELGKETRGLSA